MKNTFEVIEKIVAFAFYAAGAVYYILKMIECDMC